MTPATREAFMGLFRKKDESSGDAEEIAPQASVALTPTSIATDARKDDAPAKPPRDLFVDPDPDLLVIPVVNENGTCTIRGIPHALAREVFLALRPVFHGTRVKMTRGEAHRALRRHPSVLKHLVEERQWDMQDLAKLASSLARKHVFDPVHPSSVTRVFPDLQHPLPDPIPLPGSADGNKVPSEVTLPQLLRSSSPTPESVPPDPLIVESPPNDESEGAPKAEDPLEDLEEFSELYNESAKDRAKERSMGPFLPFKCNHIVLTNAQYILEQACYDFLRKRLPNAVKANQWDYAEQAELHQICRVLGTQRHGLMSQGLKVTASKWLNLLDAAVQIRHHAVHRSHYGAPYLRSQLREAIDLVVTMGGYAQAQPLERLVAEIENRIELIEDRKKALQKERDASLKKMDAEKDKHKAALRALDKSAAVITKETDDKCAEEERLQGDKLMKHLQLVLAGDNVQRTQGTSDQQQRTSNQQQRTSNQQREKEKMEWEMEKRAMEADMRERELRIKERELNIKKRELEVQKMEREEKKMRGEADISESEVELGIKERELNMEKREPEVQKMGSRAEREQLRIEQEESMEREVEIEKEKEDERRRETLESMEREAETERKREEEIKRKRKEVEQNIKKEAERKAEEERQRKKEEKQRRKEEHQIKKEEEQRKKEEEQRELKARAAERKAEAKLNYQRRKEEKQALEAKKPEMGKAGREAETELNDQRDKAKESGTPQPSLIRRLVGRKPRPVPNQAWHSDLDELVGENEVVEHAFTSDIDYEAAFGRAIAQDFVDNVKCGSLPGLALEMSPSYPVVPYIKEADALSTLPQGLRVVAQPSGDKRPTTDIASTADEKPEVVATEEPAVPEEPSVAEEPLQVEESSVAEESTLAEEPAVAEEPLPGQRSFRQWRFDQQARALQEAQSSAKESSPTDEVSRVEESSTADIFVPFWDEQASRIEQTEVAEEPSKDVEKMAESLDETSASTVEQTGGMEQSVVAEEPSRDVEKTAEGTEVAEEPRREVEKTAEGTVVAEEPSRDVENKTESSDAASTSTNEPSPDQKPPAVDKSWTAGDDVPQRYKNVKVQNNIFNDISDFFKNSFRGK